MTHIYVYVLDTLADWELGNITAEIYSKRFFKKDAEELSLQTVSCSKDSVHSMGGMNIIPDCLIEDMVIDTSSVLLLPGADTWSDPRHFVILEKAKEFLAAGATVCAICGATVALANCGILDNRPHTSNGPGFLEMFCPDYKGHDLYVNEPAVTDGNLITAACTGALPCAKLILKQLDVFSENTINAWYDYFSTGDVNHFYALMQSLS